MQVVTFFLQFLDYKGNSSSARTITLESAEYKPDAEQAWARDTNNASTNVTKNDVTTRNHVKSSDETDEHPFDDAIFRIGKV